MYFFYKLFRHLFVSLFFSVLFLFFINASSVKAQQTPVIINSQILSSSDDAYHVPAGWPGYSHTDATIYAGNTGGKVIWGGWRWSNINIPQDSTIVNAYVELSQQGWGSNITTTLAFENSKSPLTFSSTSTPNTRWTNKTIFSLSWSWPKQIPGAWIRTPSLTTGIQELVNAHGGITSLVLLENGTGVPSGNYHSWDSYNANAQKGAKLHIEYTSGTDTVPPTRSNGQPTGTLPDGTTQTTLSLNTNESANCKYSSIYGTIYLLMTDFTTTGSTAHSTPISGLSNGASYNFYVKCQDIAGNLNTDDYTISFSVDLPDTTAPVLSNGQPSADLPFGTTQTTLSVNTNENSNCRYATGPSMDYSQMTNTFTAIGSTVHSVTLTGLQNDTQYNYYIRCQDTTGNTNTNDYPISFRVLPDTIPPLRSNGQPTGYLATGTTQTTLSLTTDENAICKYDIASGTAYGGMANTFTVTGSTIHSSILQGLTNGTVYTYYVRCQDSLSNANTNDYSISFNVAPEGPTIINAQISSSSDDAYDVPAGWPGYSHTDAVIYAGAPGGSGSVWGGWRWINLNIPANAIISNAYVQFNQAGWGDSMTTTLAFENSQNPNTFSLISTPNTRWATRTSFQSVWTWTRQVPGSWIQTPSLTAGVQELVNRFNGINQIVLLENGTGVTQGQYHEWTSYNSNQLLGAKLHVEYTVNGNSTPTPTSTPTPSITPTITPTPTTTETNLSILPSQNPPAGLSPNQVPQFVLIGSDDNNRAGGVEFFVNELKNRFNPAGTSNPATFDSKPALISFYLIGTDIYGPNIDSQEWRDQYMAAYNNGHELGNHGFYGLANEAPRGTVDNWINNWIKPTHDAMVQMGVNPLDISGMRAVQDEIDPAFYQALKQFGYEYGNSSTTNHSTNLPAWWTGTLDNGWPGGATWDTRDYGTTQGVWEIPQIYATDQDRYCDKDWFDSGKTGAQMIADFKQTFATLYNGNRAPYSICLHSQEWGPINTIAGGGIPTAAILERQQAMKDFLDWLLNGQFSDVRIITHAQLLDWMKNPVALR